MQSQVRFNRVREKVPEKVWEALVQSQVTFNRVPEKVLEEKVQKPWCKAKSGSTGFRRRFRRRFWEALVQSQVRFNRVREKVPEKVWEALVQSQVRFHGNPAEVFPALGFAARFRKICKNTTLRLPGIPPKLIYFPYRMGPPR